MNPARTFWVAATATALLAGCGGTSAPTASPADGAFESGRSAMAAKDYAGAEQSFTTAIDAGRLDVDRMCEAHILRAVARAQLGRTAEAHADLQAIEHGAPELDRLHAARALVYRKEGKAAEAQRELAAARRYNPRVQPFGD